MGRKTYPTEYGIEPGGWTEWIHPLPGYRMACCDCGLVHEIELRIDDLGRPNLRAKRLNRHTAALRREMKKRGGRDGVA